LSKEDYYLETWNNTNATRTGQLVRVSEPRIVYEMEGENTLNFKLSESDPYYSFIVERNYIRVVKSTDKSTRSFIIQNIDIIRGGDGELFKSIDCEGLKYALMDNIVLDLNFYSNITMTDALTIALANSGFTVGTVDASADTDANRHDIQFNWPNSLEALTILIDTWDYSDSGTLRKYNYQVNEDKSIDIRERANVGTEHEFYIHPHKNMSAITKHNDVMGLANKVYGIGADGFTMYRSGRTAYSFSPLADRATGPGTANDNLEDTVNIATNDLHIGLTVGLKGMTGGSGATEKKTIIDELVGSTEFEVDSDWGVNPANGDDYKTAYLEATEDFTYVFGDYASDTNALAKGSKVVLEFLCDSNPSTSTGTSTFTIRVHLKDSGGGNIRVRSSFREIQADLSVEDSTTIQMVVEVGDWTDIKDLDVEFVSHAYSTGAGVPYIRMSRLTYTTGRNADFVQDATSISSIGTVVGKYENPDIQDTINLVLTPAFDGTYTAGLCENWTKVGNPTVAENTTSTFRTHGSSSQKITAVAVGEGVSQNVDVEFGKSYSLYAKIYIDNTDEGSVLVQIDETGASGQWQEYVNGSQWIEVFIANFTVGAGVGNIKVSILSTGEASTFYIDAAMVHQGPEIHPFVDGDTADILYDEALTHLNQVKDAIVTYEIDLFNLYELNRGELAEEDFDEGDLVRIVDRDQSLDSKFQVVRKEYDLFNPQEAKILLENKRNTFKKSFEKWLLKTTGISRG